MITSSLNQIKRPIETEISKFNGLFKSSLKSKSALLDLVTKYIFKQKSKKIRPMLVFLSSKTAGESNERSYRGAILVELLHTATLVHDDVVDNAEKRRGLPSINAVWKNKIAVLLGDYLLAKGLMLAVDGEDFDFLKIITDTVRRMSEGELLQISKTQKLNIDEETYFRIISDKTASLFSTCCEIGARSSTQDPEKIEALKKFGENLGIAFQIRDDILDFVGKSGVIGKPLGGDIKEKKLTLPLIYTLNKKDKAEADKIKKLIRKSGKKNNLQTVINYVKENGGIEYSYKVAKEYSDSAKENLKIFSDSESRRALETLLDFVIDRKN